MSQRYCCGVNSLASSSLRGHWKLPDSRRLYSSRNHRPPSTALDSVPASATEQKQRVGERIQLELLLNDAGQTIDSSLRSV